MQEPRFEPVRMGTVGLRNFGGAVYRQLAAESARPDGVIRLVAVCQRPGSAEETVAEARARGVRVVERFEDLLNEPIEAVWLPLPIHLHRAFTEQALAAGKAVLCEKPIAGCVDDVDAMIAAEQKAGLPVAIGYQDMYNPLTLRLKKRLLDGAIGRLRWITTHGAGPRGDRYFGRSRWAGRFQVDGQWVMDSIAHNAHAHEINLCLFLAGGELPRSAVPLAVEAELYRANPIENFDTIGMRLTLDSGVELLVLLTHGCEFYVDSFQVIQGEKGRVLRTRDVVVIERDGRAEVWRSTLPARDYILPRFARAVRGIPDTEIGMATLENGRSQVVAVNGASEAAAIGNVPESFKRHPQTNQGVVHAVIGMEAMLTLCARRRVLFHESGLFPWTVPAGRKDLRGYRHFAGPRT